MDPRCEISPGTPEASDTSTLKVLGLKKYFPVTAGFLKQTIGWVRAVDDVSFSVHKGEVFGLVGESGCGKSTMGKTILGIYRPTQGSVIFKDVEISALSMSDAKKARKEIQYVYQDAGASLDPWWTVGRSLREPMKIHTRMSTANMNRKVEEMLLAVGLQPEHMYRFPHEFSGGQQRRLGLARILTINPSLVIFDEPTAGLDVSVQATILKLLKDLKNRFDLTYIFISHDLGVIRLMCDRVAVMYLGRIVEMAPAGPIFKDPFHPYTQALIAAIPKPIVDPHAEDILLEGEPPRPDLVLPGCRFEPRCTARQKICTQQEPVLREIIPGHWLACHRV
jgi:oligopeptide transport system ATP-binding protein